MDIKHQKTHHQTVENTLFSPFSSKEEQLTALLSWWEQEYRFLLRFASAQKQDSTRFQRVSGRVKRNESGQSSLYLGTNSLEKPLESGVFAQKTSVRTCRMRARVVRMPSVEASKSCLSELIVVICARNPEMDPMFAIHRAQLADKGLFFPPPPIRIS